jgi:hypothetical protein
MSGLPEPATSHPVLDAAADVAVADQLPADWTPIAFRPRRSRYQEPLLWSSVFEAPIDIEAAHRLRKLGAIIMASRHTADRVVLVVRRAASSSRNRPTGC